MYLYFRMHYFREHHQKSTLHWNQGPSDMDFNNNLNCSTISYWSFNILPAIIGLQNNGYNNQR